MWYNRYTILCASALIFGRASASERIPSAASGSRKLKNLFSQPYWLDQRSDVPEQYVAVGREGERLYSVILEFREDEQGEILHLVTLWKSTKEEIRLYEENS
jgi:uncharacterized DUF497 family protein